MNLFAAIIRGRDIDGRTIYNLVIFHEFRLVHISVIPNTRAVTLIAALTNYINNLGPEVSVNLYFSANSRFHRVSIGTALK